MYDLIIVGGGPAGVAAGVYAARKKIKALLVAESFGGQSLVSADIQNWIGTKSISGFDLGRALEEHLKAQEGIEILEGERVAKIMKAENGLKLETNNGKTLEAKYVLLASGSRRRRLNVPGEDKYDGKGVVFCSTCDAPIFKGKTVAVVGGGNAGLEAVVDLFPYAAKIYLIVRSDAPKGDPVTLEKVLAHRNVDSTPSASSGQASSPQVDSAHSTSSGQAGSPRVEIITNADTTEIFGEQFVAGMKYKDRPSGEMKELKVEGVFVEIGAVPNSEIAKGLADINERGEIIVDHKTQRSSNPDVWAVGDVSDVLYKQNNISAGDAIKAVLNIYERLMK
ncbi:MAG: FAD-dependent oxidoreductase [Candidatus Liptonbacteria bacterium]|nr:FAD-dependent oxidoreductase [Candidatus Liptonbacteria bacterium]